MAHSTSQRTWARFSAAFEHESGALQQLIAERSFELPSYEHIGDEHLLTEIERGLGGLGSVLAERRVLTKEELGLYWSVTKGQADFGVTMQDSLTAWHIGLDVLCQWARNEVALDRHPREVLVDFLDLSVAWWRQGSDTAIDYYRQAATHPETPRKIAVDGLFWDIASARADRAELEEKFSALGLDPAAGYHALRAKPAGPEEANRFRAWTGIVDDASLGEAALIGGQVWAFVRELPAGDHGAPVGRAAAVHCSELSTAFQAAGRALNAAISLGLRGCQGLESLGVKSAVLLDHALGSALVSQYVDPIVELGAIGADVLRTVRAYIDNHGNFELAAAELFVHPNTVRYRVRRFEKAIGASLRDTSTFVSVWWALERYRLQDGHVLDSSRHLRRIG